MIFICEVNHLCDGYHIINCFGFLRTGMHLRSIVCLGRRAIGICIGIPATFSPNSGYHRIHSRMSPSSNASLNRRIIGRDIGSFDTVSPSSGFRCILANIGSFSGSAPHLVHIRCFLGIDTRMSLQTRLGARYTHSHECISNLFFQCCITSLQDIQDIGDHQNSLVDKPNQLGYHHPNS